MDAATFSREATACQRLLYHICWAMMHNEADCADAVQEALLRAWQRRESLRDPEAFRPWLCRITANVCKDMLRRQHRRRMVPLPENLAAAPYDEDGLPCVRPWSSFPPSSAPPWPCTTSTGFPWRRSAAPWAFPRARSSPASCMPGATWSSCCARKRR